jgi:hypothetical protein
MSLSPTHRDLDKAYQRAKFTTDVCPHNGDGWYYLSLIQQKLNMPKREIDFSLERAERYESSALTQKIDPFAISAPQDDVKTDALCAHKR